MMLSHFKKLFSSALLFSGLALLTTQAFAAADTLKQEDFVGISFWIISMALVASTVFFF